MNHFHENLQEDSMEVRERELERRLETLIEKKVQTSLESLIKNVSDWDC